MKQTRWLAGLVTCLLGLAPFAIAQPVPPHPISPPAGETNASFPLIFQWEPSPGAEKYEFQIMDRNQIPVLRRVLYRMTRFEVQTGQLSAAELYYWQVRSIRLDATSEWSEKWGFIIQENPWFCDEGVGPGETRTGYAAAVDHPGSCLQDHDQDGIPDAVEINVIHTNPEMKTLFVRPQKEVDIEKYEYWEEFIDLFKGDRRGFADIPPFTEAGIEVVVVGCCGHPPCSRQCHPRYPGFDEFDYDPAEDGIPCSIMEIVLTRERNSEGGGIYCAYGMGSRGHTYLAVGSTYRNGELIETATWSWDTKGYTPPNEIHHGYFIPRIYPFPLQKYFDEGAYDEISKDESPVTTDCYLSSAECNRSSPMNLNVDDQFPNPPYTMRPDSSVEFNHIGFDASGIITFVGESGKRYSYDDVLRRTIAHEMGHALLTADQQDHCSNPCCLMHRNTLDWEMRPFGGRCRSACGDSNAYQCQHSPGGSQDIRLPGIVSNSSP